jgi:hypothetical protein
MFESDTASLLLIADEFIDLSSVGGCGIEWKGICSGLFTGEDGKSRGSELSSPCDSAE